MDDATLTNILFSFMEVSSKKLITASDQRGEILGICRKAVPAKSSACQDASNAGPAEEVGTMGSSTHLKNL